MTNLSTEQLLYLLYAVTYSTKGTVTKGTVKDHLPKKLQKHAKDIHEALSKQKLIEATKRGRLAVTDEGQKTLGYSLRTTKYRFDSQKGPKVLNTLLSHLQEESSEASSASSEEMDFYTFVEKFKKLYFEEKRYQELRGVVMIRTREIKQKFHKENSISQSKLDKYFEMLKSQGKVSVIQGRDDELIRWVE